jgi:hypothetical protein
MAKQPAKKPAQSVKKTTSVPSASTPLFLFGRKNFMILFAGLALLAVGFLLMTGGSQPPNQFDPDVVYSFRRTTLSTIFVVIGFLVILYSIFQKHEPQEIQKDYQG